MTETSQTVIRVNYDWGKQAVFKPVYEDTFPSDS